MEVIGFDHLDETLYADRLSNGLTVCILPKAGFSKTFATFTTKYGSIDSHFRVAGRDEEQVPDGIAHFLEHKMFEEPTGDIFATFASQGASANAFTSHDRTAYLFSATEQVNANIETLLNFVQNPYFTDENVEKEKGIIGQEINMYQDNADFRVYSALLKALFVKHPVHIDIAGTIDSIAAITKETLYACYRTFYHPSNMLLFVVGGVDPEETMMLVRDNQAGKSFDPQGEIIRYYDEEPGGVREKRFAAGMAVSMPKCLIGFKDPAATRTGRELLEQECATKILLDMMFSPSSPLYERLYDEGIITDQFGADYQCAPEYGYSMIGGDTPDPDKLVERVRGEVERMRREGLDPAAFERSKRKKIGGFLRMLNSPEAIAYEFTKYRFRGADLFDLSAVYESLSPERVAARLDEHMDLNRMAVSIVSKREATEA